MAVREKFALSVVYLTTDAMTSIGTSSRCRCLSSRITSMLSVGAML